MDRLTKSLASRRALVGGLLAAGSAGLVAATTAKKGVPTTDEAGIQQSRERLRNMRTPNELLVDENGRSVRFYDDVMKDRKVIINVMYSVCANICAPSTRNLLDARALLGKEAKDLHFVSMTLTPLTDGPEQLREFKKLHGVDDNWTFLTGKLENVEKVQKAMGFIGEAEGDNLLSHSAMARVCDERFLRWSHVNTTLSARSIARMIRFALV